MKIANDTEKEPILAVGFTGTRIELYWQNGQLLVDTMSDTLESPNHPTMTFAAQYCLRYLSNWLASDDNYPPEQKLAWDAMCKEIRRQRATRK